MNMNSYVAADVLPVKLLQNLDVLHSVVVNGIVPPIHPQLILTNKCNLDCPYCSCAENDREQEMFFDKFLDLLESFVNLEVKAVTITGGGEPLLYPQIEYVIDSLWIRGIQVGLVTNGTILHKVDKGVLGRLTWCRISHDDHRPFNVIYASKLSDVVKSCPNVDWAFSYVLTHRINVERVTGVVSFANEFNFTHVRLVSDLLRPEDVPMEGLRQELPVLIDDSKVIYQGRKEPEKGMPCYICYLKPIIGADFRIYTCCGAQYALQEPTKGLPKELCLGSANDLSAIIDKSSIAFDGSICARCYYGGYNRLLAAMLERNITHRLFV